MATTLKLEADFTDRADEVSFLQAVRTWERAHQHVQVAIQVHSTDRSAREAEEIFNQIDPGFPYRLYQKVADRDGA